MLEKQYSDLVKSLVITNKIAEDALREIKSFEAQQTQVNNRQKVISDIFSRILSYSISITQLLELKLEDYAPVLTLSRCVIDSYSGFYYFTDPEIVDDSEFELRKKLQELRSKFEEQDLSENKEEFNQGIKALIEEIEGLSFYQILANKQAKNELKNKIYNSGLFSKDSRSTDWETKKTGYNNYCKKCYGYIINRKDIMKQKVINLINELDKQRECIQRILPRLIV